MKLRRAELAETIADASNQLARVEAHIRQIEEEGKMPEGDVIIKNVEPMLVAGKRIVIPKHSGGVLPELNDAFMQAAGYVAQHNAFDSKPDVAVLSRCLSTNLKIVSWRRSNIPLWLSRTLTDCRL
ncbi:MAG: hypothetical protein DCC52_01570 [Chloroflexi bacterium]|nr:MAG: hypothetical protein DCC52_01570 [Chloroflexota bacterium]